jgi:hypothetical protein
MSGNWKPSDFPHLNKLNHKIKSDPDPSYNCLSWAAEEPSRRWDPTFGYYWPPGAPRQRTVEAFVKAFETKGCEVCKNADLEEEFEKIAIYADGSGIGTHVARQLKNGEWTSKIGDFQDIEHSSLKCLNGPCYGSPVAYMRRPMPPSSE